MQWLKKFDIFSEFFSEEITVGYLLYIYHEKKYTNYSIFKSQRLKSEFSMNNRTEIGYSYLSWTVDEQRWIFKALWGFMECLRFGTKLKIQNFFFHIFALHVYVFFLYTLTVFGMSCWFLSYFLFSLYLQIRYPCIL